jgi:hypothetical protein
MRRFIHKHRERLQEIGIGFFLYETFNFFYDWLFYPFALVYWGVVHGGIVLFAGSLIQCALMFWLYDRMRVDWLGANALRQLETKEHKNRLEHLAVWLGKEKKSLWERLLSPIVFIALTLPIDPLIVAIHYRKKHFTGITARDWFILLSAVLVANAWWLLKIEILVQFFKQILHQFTLWG